MSHITCIKTKMSEKEYLTQALTDLGYQWETGDVSVSGFGFQRRKVEIKVKGGLFGHEFGFAKSGGLYDLVADWWGVSTAQRDKLRQQLSQRYAYHTARAKLEAQGFNLATEEQQADGQIRLVLRRVVN